MLRSVGLDVDDVTVVPLNPLSFMPPALANREFQDRGIYRELFNLNTTAAKLADPGKRAAIVAFVRALIAASAEIERRPSRAWALVAKSTGYDAALIERVWHHEGYPGALVPDLLDVLVDEEIYVAKERNRVPRSRTELADLIDDSVLREALGR
jgi:ABC-type nitrate/sulfonate/bicarbonate transport system substrate-binding protein